MIYFNIANQFNASAPTMALDEHKFTFRKSTLSFIRGGSGDHVLLLFHGFGQDCHIFEELIEQKGHLYTVYSFDLFFHGKSEWNYGEQPVEPDFWAALLGQFLKEYGITRFSVGGFSIGARLALATSVAFATRIDRLILIAPDGIGSDFIYTLSTRPLPVRWLFRYSVTHPGMFIKLSDLLQESGILSRRLTRFAAQQMSTPENRSKVYFTWVVFRHISFAPGKLATILNHNSIAVSIILGKSDPVISGNRLRRFVQRLNNPDLIEIRAGHTTLVAEAIRSQLI